MIKCICTHTPVCMHAPGLSLLVNLSEKTKGSGERKTCRRRNVAAGGSGEEEGDLRGCLGEFKKNESS